MDGDDQDITDPTDWLGTPLASLVSVESALRCQVCKDFYKTPMLTSCNHTFCSACIRRALLDEGKCPLCRKGDQESKLRSNWSILDAVQAFMSARPALVQVARNPPAHAPCPASTSPKHTLEDDADGDETRRSSKRLRSAARASKTRAMESTAEMARQEIDLTHDPEPEPEPNDGLVACPVCQQRMKEALVFGHLETSCPGEVQPQKPARSTPANSLQQNAISSAATVRSIPQLERLPAINYSMFKEAALRKKLQELGISSQGSKAMLEKRHKEWMTLWNANCDSLDPKRKSELLRELDSWERTQGSFAPTSSKSANQGAQIKAKDFDGAAWAAKHDNSFQDLIAQARASKKKAQAPVTDVPLDSNESETHNKRTPMSVTAQVVEISEAVQEVQGRTPDIQVRSHPGEPHSQNSFANSYPVCGAQSREPPQEQARRHESELEAQMSFPNGQQMQQSPSQDNHPMGRHQTFASPSFQTWDEYGHQPSPWPANPNFHHSLPFSQPEEDMRARPGGPGPPPFYDYTRPHQS